MQHPASLTQKKRELMTPKLAPAAEKEVEQKGRESPIPAEPGTWASRSTGCFLSCPGGRGMASCWQIEPEVQSCCFVPVSINDRCCSQTHPCGSYDFRTPFSSHPQEALREIKLYDLQDLEMTQLTWATQRGHADGGRRGREGESHLTGLGFCFIGVECKGLEFCGLTI